MVEYSFTFEHLQYFILILVRVSAFMVTAPLFNISSVTARVRVGCSIFLSLILFYTLPDVSIEYSEIIEYSIIVLKEGITGLLIGFAAYLCNSIILFAGNLIDTQIGLAMASEYDPVSRTQVTISGEFYNYIVLLLLLVSGLFTYLINAFVEAYTLIPVNGAVFEWENLATALITYITDLMIIAFRIILPVFAVTMITNCILGIMSKVASQMNMFSVGIQIKVFMGFAAMFLTITLLPYVSDYIFTEMRKMIVLFVKSMY